MIAATPVSIARSLDAIEARIEETERRLAEFAEEMKGRVRATQAPTT